MTELLCISVALVAGLLMTRLLKRLHLPDVTSYLIAGVLLGPCIIGRLGLTGIGFVSFEQVEILQPISDVALGFIAFAIGSEFRFSSLKKTGGAAVVVGIFQAFTATVLVDLALLGLHLFLGDKLPVSAAITLGAIAAATAPAATLMVVRQYKAKGPVTDILLPVVALDDAVGLVIFAISFGAAQAMTTSEASAAAIIVEPLLEIVLSLVLGAILGWILTFMERWFHSNRNRVAMIAGFVVLAVALSMSSFQIAGLNLKFSSLLVCMMLGTVFCNTCPTSEDLMNRADKWSAPLLTLFFVLSGAALRLDVFQDVAIVGIGLVYILARSIGKYVGARVSSKAAHCSPEIQKYLGITLLPQAGVALGMASQVGALGEIGSTIRSIVLFGVLIYELVGPTLTKMALTAAGDIHPKEEPAKTTA
ncbi:cation:proton antiporter [uncultured Neglectibacter sp.]|uniref:cation:proton antiporter n=1 Tax=uncultured Neglectibacter sp. TaxID=1924108 RepID=UPI0034DE2B3C